MSKKLILLISVLVLSLACTSQAIVVGDFEDGLDGWAPSGDNTLTQSTIGATTGAGSALIEGPGSWQMLAVLDIKSLRSVLAGDNAAISADVTAFAEDMQTDWMNMEMIINGQNDDANGANNNIGWQSLGGLDIVIDGVSQTLTWEVPADLSAKIAGTDDNIAWFELFIVTNNGAANTKIYIDNIQLIGAEPEPEPEQTGPTIAWVSYHAADDEPHADAAAVGFTQAPDIEYTDLLKAQGYNVVRVLTSQTPDVDYLNTMDLVIISRTASSGHYSGSGATAWNSITAPMINLNGYTLRSSRLGFTDGTDMPDTTGDVRLTVTDPTHPIFAGIALTDGTMDNLYAEGAVPLPTDGVTLSRGISINNNNIDDEGTVLATIAEASADTGPVGGMVIAELPAGATMENSSGSPTDVLGGPRLVFLTGSREPDGVTGGQAAALYDLYPDGEQMFLNAVAYMLGMPKVAWVSYHAADDEPHADAAAVGFTQAPDIGYTDLLKANGYYVVRVLTSQTPDVEYLNTMDLVIISRTASSGHYSGSGATAWNSITAPMINLNGYTLRSSRLGFTDGTDMPDTTGDVRLTITDPTHPIFAGIALTDGTMDNPYAEGAVPLPTDGTISRGISINNNNIDDEGTVLATIAEASADTGPVGGMVIAELPAGATMENSSGSPDDVLGGPRLVFLTGSREPDGVTGGQAAALYDLYPDGEQMFLNAVDYMIPVVPVDPGTDGLVALFAFENDTTDGSGNGLDGTVIGDPVFVEGVAGMALDFSGDDYVDCGGVAEFSFTDAMTVSTWVNIRSRTTAWMAMIAKGENAWRLGVNNETTGIHYGFTGGTRGWQAANTATELSFDEWYHVAATYDTTVGATVYINGVPDASNPDTGGIPVNEMSLLLGENPEATGRLFDGMLDEIMIYNRALSEEEILFLAGQ